MKSWQKLVLVSTVLSLMACGTGTELTRRYKSMANEQQPPGKPSLVRASAFVVEKPKSDEEPGVLQLGAQGQAALITAIAKADHTVPELYEQLAKGFVKQPSITVIDRSQITVRIIFSTQKTDATGSADRISRLEFNLTGLPDDLRFHQWNRFETEYGQSDLGKVGLKKSTTLSAKLSPEFGGVLNAGEAGVAISRELSDEIALRQRYIALTGILDTHRASLVQEGAIGIDLTGNTSIDLTIQFYPGKLEPHDVVRFDSFKKKTGLKTPDEISYRKIQLHMPTQDVVKKLCDIGMILTRFEGNYKLRQVRKGDETITEGDDVGAFIQGEIEVAPQKIIMLMSPGQLNEQLKQMRSSFLISKWDHPGETLAIETPSNPNLPIEFATYEEAEEFLNWVSRQKTFMVGGDKVKLDKKPLVQTDIVKLRIRNRESGICQLKN